MNNTARGCRDFTNCILSAVVASEWYWINKDDGEWVTRLYWVHPHQYVRETLGKPMDILDYNVAGVLEG